MTYSWETDMTQNEAVLQIGSEVHTSYKCFRVTFSVAAGACEKSVYVCVRGRENARTRQRARARERKREKERERESARTRTRERTRMRERACVCVFVRRVHVCVGEKD